MSNIVNAKSILYKPYIHIPVIIFITFLIYSDTFIVPFQFDDTSIAASISIRNPYNYLPPMANRDIGYLTFSLNYQLDGLDVFGYHAVNLLIHMLNALHVYYLIFLTFKTPFFFPSRNSVSKQNVFVGAFFTSGLFAVHPLQTESVTYIVQRFTSLATLFCLLSLVTYIRARLACNSPEDQKNNKPHIFWVFYLASIFFAVLAMKTKEIAFTLPLCIAVYEFMFFKEKPIKRSLYLIPLLLTMLLIPMTLLSLNAPIGEIIGDVSVVTRDHPEIPRSSYLFTQFRVIVTYIRLLFIPINQNLDYDYPVYHSLFDPAVLFSFIFLLLVFGLGVYLYRVSGHTETNERYWLRLTSFGIFWFFITLSVESSVIPIRDVIFEHRIYLPSIGFFIALIAVIGEDLERGGYRPAYVKKAILYVMLVVMLVLSGATYARNAVWQDGVRLWENTVEGSPNKARPHIRLGLAYFDQGGIDEAVNEYRTALKIEPGDVGAHNDLGVAYVTQGRIDKAINEYQTALKLNPDYIDAHNNLGVAYTYLGQINEAIREYQASLKLDPGLAKTHYNLGLAYENTGRINDAFNEYQTALKINPDLAEAYFSLGNVYKTRGMIDEAIKEYQIALGLVPDFFQAHNNLGLAYASQGRINEAIKEYQIVLKFNPDSAMAHYNLGNIYLKQGRIAEAINAYQTALKINPDFTEARRNLDLILKK